MRAPIKAILHVFTSERDSYGNCYHAAQYIDCASGVMVRFGDIGGDMNMNALPRLLGHESDHVYHIHEVLPKRRWKMWTKDFPYLANHADEQAAQIVRDAITAGVDR